MEHYDIFLEGYIDKKRINYFECMSINHLPSGCTLLSGEVKDQAELYSILSKIRDMGIPLIKLERKEGIEKEVEW